MAIQFPVAHSSVEMKENRKQTVLPKTQPRKCTTKHFGIRVSLVPFGYDGNKVLVPFKKHHKSKAWTLLYEVPFLDESIDETAHRLYSTYVPNQQATVDQVFTFGQYHVDRKRWITILYSTIINLGIKNNKSSSVEWLPLLQRPLLTRLEDQMIDTALGFLQRKVRHEPVGIYMLPPEFTLQQFQRMYEVLLGHPISKDAFRKRMWESEILIPLEETVKESGRSQPKGLYRFNKKKYNQLKRGGFFLDL